MSTIEIPLNKVKIIYGISGSFIFIVAGIWFLTGFPENAIPVSPAMIKIFGVISILFFGVTFIVYIKKIFDKKPGLIINENGIIDNTSGVSIGLIEWTYITGIRQEQILTTRFLLIDTNDAEKFVAKATGLKARMMRANYNSYGTPLSVASTTLRCDFDELEIMLKTAMAQYGGY